jgi:uncharacterized BrkB/YihY/UPF0761 family membrane protein
VICHACRRLHHDHTVSTGARELTGLRRAITRVYQMYWGSGLVDDVPAMAWFLVTACVPLSLGIVAVASIVLGDAQQANAVARNLAASSRAARVAGSSSWSFGPGATRRGCWRCQSVR